MSTCDQEADDRKEGSPTFDEWEPSSKEESFEPMPLMYDSGSGSDDSLLRASVAAVQSVSTQAPEGVGGGQRSSSSKRKAVEATTAEMPIITRRRKKRKGMPKRGLSAYNLYFQRERQNIMDGGQSEGKLSFEELGKLIGKRWKELSAGDREEFDALAVVDGDRYVKEMKVFNEEKRKRILHIDGGGGDKTDDVKLPPMRPMSPSSMQQQHTPSLHHHHHHSGMQLYDSAGPVPPPMYSPASQRHPPPHPLDRFPPPPYPSVASARSPPCFPSELAAAATAGAPPMPPLPHYYPPPPVHGSGGPPPGRSPSRSPRRSSASAVEQQQQQPPQQPTTDLFPIPPGMELMLPDRDGRERKYRVQYACYTMTREAAQEYIDSLSGALASHSVPPPPPAYARVDDGFGSAAAQQQQQSDRSSVQAPWGNY